MDAIEFLKAFNRICNNHRETCMTCPLERESCDLTSKYCNHEKVVSIVEKWEKGRPIKTRQSEFLKQFPDALLDENGVIDISPCIVSRGFRVDCSNRDTLCPTCRRTYWMQEVK